MIKQITEKFKERNFKYKEKKVLVCRVYCSHCKKEHSTPYEAICCCQELKGNLGVDF